MESSMVVMEVESQVLKWGESHKSQVLVGFELESRAEDERGGVVHGVVDDCSRIWIKSWRIKFFFFLKGSIRIRFVKGYFGNTTFSLIFSNFI